jgi:tetratricopeptide (TPR) repeat protein
MKLYFRVVGIGMLAAAAAIGQGAIGQGSDSRCPVNGEISPAGPGVGSLTAELSPVGQGPTETAMVSGGGNFEIRSLAAGLYTLRILGAGGRILHEESVIVSCSRGSFTIRIPEPQSESHSRDSSISVQQLLHKVPPQARKAFEKGKQAQAKGNHQQAEELFRQAIAIDPKFADAYNDLGASQAELGDLPASIESFQKAIDIVPEHRVALANLCIALAKTRRYDEASAAARRALQFTPESSTLRYILATSLLLVKGESEEVLFNFERSADEVPLAHLMAAEILARRGKRTEAARHVEEYLRVVPASDKHRIRAEAMLASLRS